MLAEEVIPDYSLTIIQKLYWTVIQIIGNARVTSLYGIPLQWVSQYLLLVNKHMNIDKTFRTTFITTLPTIWTTHYNSLRVPVFQNF